MCPAAYELLLWRRGQLSQPAAARVQQHVAQCKHCQTVLSHEAEIWGDLTDRPVPETIQRALSTRLDVVAPDVKVAGQIWMARNVPGILLIAEAGEEPDTYRALPISFETKFMSNRDVWVAAAESPLGASAMVETWLEVPVDEQGLSRFVGVLDPTLVACALRVADGLEPTLQGRLGPPLAGKEDPRYDFELHEADFWRPVSASVDRTYAGHEEESVAVSTEVTVLGTVSGGGYTLQVLGYAGTDQGRLVALTQPPDMQGSADILMIQVVALPDGHVEWRPADAGVPVTSSVADVLRHGSRVARAQEEPILLTQTV
jgi:hypothetical protein